MPLLIGVAAAALLMGAAPATKKSATPQPQKPAASAAESARWEPVAEALGRTGTLLPGGVYKVTIPRADDVTLARVALRPPMASTAWAGFLDTPHGTLVMGDLVLLQNEIVPVMNALRKGGIEVSGLHNHLVGESPRLMYLHFHGHGDAKAMASTIRDAVMMTKTSASGSSALPAPALELPASEINFALGKIGTVNNGVLQFAFPRAEKIMENGVEIPPSLGMATSISFQPTGAGRAAATGDFVLLASEVNEVVRVLEEGKVQVTAIHNHMLTEEPRLFFLHFWGNDDAKALSETLRVALSKTNIAR